MGVERKPGALKDSLWRHGDGCLKQRASGLTFCYVFFSTAQHVYSSPRCVQKWTGVNSLYAIDRSFIYYRFLWTQIILKLIGSSGFCLTPGALCKHLRNILTDERMTASSTLTWDWAVPSVLDHVILAVWLLIHNRAAGKCSSTNLTGHFQACLKAINFSLVGCGVLLYTFKAIIQLALLIYLKAYLFCVLPP